MWINMYLVMYACKKFCLLSGSRLFLRGGIKTQVQRQWDDLAGKSTCCTSLVTWVWSLDPSTRWQERTDYCPPPPHTHQWVWFLPRCSLFSLTLANLFKRLYPFLHQPRGQMSIMAWRLFWGWAHAHTALSAWWRLHVSYYHSKFNFPEGRGNIFYFSVFLVPAK